MFQSIVSIKKFIKLYNKNADFKAFQQKKILGIAPSYEHIYMVQKGLKHNSVMIGAQDCSQFLYGAHTGQVSVQSLSDLQVSFCIIGHSEARQFLLQSDEQVFLKFKLLLAAHITPIFCIGETLQQKEEGLTLQVLFDQLETVLQYLQSYQGSTKIFIAYEPIYAIGSGIVPSKDELQNVFSFLNSLISQVPVAKNVMFLYGGSVSSSSISQLDQIKELSGFLIGKSSIDFQDLKKIVESE